MNLLIMHELDKRAVAQSIIGGLVKENKSKTLNLPKVSTPERTWLQVLAAIKHICCVLSSAVS